MDAYHLAIFGAGWCPTQPMVGDKRKRYEESKSSKPACVAVGGDVFLYARKDTAPSQPERKAKGGNLSAIKEDQPPLSQAAKASMLQKTRQTSRRWSAKGKNAFAGATSSFKNLFSTSKPPPSSLLEDEDDIPQPKYKKLKFSSWGQ